MFFSRSSLTATLLGCVALVPCPGHGEVFRYRPGDDLTQRLRNLQAGDEVVLAGGEYNLGSRFSIGGQGRDDAPIVIRAAEGETPVITRPNANQNTINIEGATHLALVGVEVRGGSHGIRINDSSFITIRDCEVHRTGDVAISANIAGSRYEGLHIVGNHVHHTGGTGEGMYLGCNDGACAMFDSVVEGNYVHHTNQGTSQGDGIEIKRGSFDNIVRDNVIHDTRYPCVLVYGSEEGGPNVIEGNVMWGCGDHAIQAAADTHIVNNLILGAAQDGIRAQPHQGGVPSNLRIVHNTVINAGTAIRLDQVAGPVVVANNALYSTNGAALRASGTLRELTVSGNVGQGGLQGVDGGVDLGGRRGRDFVAAAELDAFPTRNSALLGAADPDFVVGRDFNGTPRGDSLDVGAYVFSAEGNPGWTVGPDFKPAGEVVDPPEADAGPSNPNPDAGGEDPDAGGEDPDAGGEEDPDAGGEEDPDAGGEDPDAGDEDPDTADSPRRDLVCAPGETQACVCTSSALGAQDCRDDRTGWSACVCAGSDEGSDPGSDAHGGCEISTSPSSAPWLLLLLLVWFRPGRLRPGRSRADAATVPLRTVTAQPRADHLSRRSPTPTPTATPSATRPVSVWPTGTGSS